MNPSVGAVIVSFQPDLVSLRSLVATLSPQVSSICIVDNGSAPSAVEALTSLALEFETELILFSTNRGIAAAHNAAIGRLAEHSLEYVVLFDQDSLPAPFMVTRLVTAHLDLIRSGVDVAAVGPLSLDVRTGSSGKFVRVEHGRVRQLTCSESDGVVEVDFLISSGTLIPMEMVSRVGLMNEGYFIDHVDTEWCARARTAGLRLFGICSARLQHSLGDSVVRVWFGRWREVSLHSPVRDYYMVRNTILMLRTPSLPWGWRVAHLVRISQFLVFMCVAVAPRGRRLAMMLKGIAHGIVGRTGAL